MAGTRVTMETASDHSQVTMKTTGIAKTMNHDQKRRCAISCPSAVTQPLFCKIKAHNFVSKKNDKAKCHKTKQNNDGHQPSIKIKIPKRNTKTNPTEAQVREAIAKHKNCYWGQITIHLNNATEISHSGGDKGMKMGIKYGRGNDRWSGGECGGGGTKMMAGQQGLGNVLSGRGDDGTKTTHLDGRERKMVTTDHKGLSSRARLLGWCLGR